MGSPPEGAALGRRFALRAAFSVVGFACSGSASGGLGWLLCNSCLLFVVGAPGCCGWPGATWETAFRRRFLLDSRYTWGFGVPAAAGRWLEPATGLVRRLFDLSARDERNPLWWWWRGLRSGHQCCGPSSFARPFRERPCPAPGTVSCLAASLALSVGADGHPWPDFRQVRVGLSAIHSADGAVRGLPLAVG